MLPGLSGLELLRRRRRSGDHACVIMLSARGEEEIVWSGWRPVPTIMS